MNLLQPAQDGTPKTYNDQDGGDCTDTTPPCRPRSDHPSTVSRRRGRMVHRTGTRNGRDHPADTWDAVQMTADVGGRLTEAELRDLAQLLARYASHDLDQWDNWRIETSHHGPVYVTIANSLHPGWPEEAFTTIWPLPPRLTEDPATGQPDR
ncbi:hypothetical protein Prum_091130 [Phytohabitans rumicis]|uniref:Uncharacterized protein n=1 Tax=Phytohabitans rumicis TaxID=1076125 RepID=A0A6V8LKK3_9ACTN|nr:hypothetical protein Prum_091130 [Phytohabitans rumicis]